MGLLGNLFGGDDQRQDLEGFIGRFTQGRPWEGISDDEAIGRYQQVSSQLSPEQYQESAREAFERLSPDERAEFARSLRQRAREQNLRMPDLDDDDDYRAGDPDRLARSMSWMRQEQPGVLEGLLGGSGGQGALSSPLAKAALAGIAAFAAQKLIGRG